MEKALFSWKEAQPQTGKVKVLMGVENWREGDRLIYSVVRSSRTGTGTTGHRTAAVVLKHYFRPGREDFRAVLAQAMPKMLGHGSTKSRKQQMKELLEGMTVRTWNVDRKRLLELIEVL